MTTEETVINAIMEHTREDMVSPNQTLGTDLELIDLDIAQVVMAIEKETGIIRPDFLEGDPDYDAMRTWTVKDLSDWVERNRVDDKEVDGAALIGEII